MTFYDIFNGDADGICALHQLRLAAPRDSVLVTGVKRDVRLLERVPAGPGDELTVLDISLAANAAALDRVLAAGARCRWFDHHAAGTVPGHPGLDALIDTAPDTCTSLIVDRHLNAPFRAWAVVAAFGDGLRAAALRAAAVLALAPDEVERLQQLGEAMNYNAYGETTDDLHYHPADLYLALRGFPDPLEFIVAEPVFEVLRNACHDDLDRAIRARPERATAQHAVVILPDAAWSRRVHGVLGNRLAHAAPARALAVLVVRPGGYRVSVRAPIERPRGADALCMQFPSGGGRAGAAGINHLPEQDYPRFVAAFEAAFTAGS